MLPAKKTEQVLDPNSQRILLYGAPKVGKSTFCSGLTNGDALFLDTEDGLKHLSTYRIPVTSWGEFLVAVDELKEAGDRFPLVVVDTIDNLYEMAQRHVCAHLGIQDPGDRGGGLRAWGLINRAINDGIKRLAYGSRGVVFVSHEKTVECSTSDGHVIKHDERFKGQVTLKVQPSARGEMGRVCFGLVDIIIRACVVGGQRVIQAAPTENITAGDRTGILPAQFPLDPGAFVQLFRDEYKRRSVKSEVS